MVSCGFCDKIRRGMSCRRNGSVSCLSLLGKEMQPMMRNCIVFLGLSGVVEHSALVGHNTTSLSFLFGAFRRNGLLLSSRIQKSATKLCIFLIFVVPSIVLYSSEISPTRCNNCVFILRSGFTLHVSGDRPKHVE